MKHTKDTKLLRKFSKLVILKYYIGFKNYVGGSIYSFTNFKKVGVALFHELLKYFIFSN